jgi:hypothetical protein
MNRLELRVAADIPSSYAAPFRCVHVPLN